MRKKNGGFNNYIDGLIKFMNGENDDFESDSDTKRS